MKQFFFRFGSGNPAAYTGLSPSFTIFSSMGLTSIAGPGITETPVGSGIYNFNYNATLAIVFVIDGGNTVSSSDRYVTNVLDPIQAVDEKIGFNSDSFGTTFTDPNTLFGYMKRSLEWHEGDQIFNKSSGIWDIASRGSTFIWNGYTAGITYPVVGTSTLLREKSLANNVTQATRLD